MFGMKLAMKSGLGTASMDIGRGVIVGAIVAVNAMRDAIHFDPVVPAMGDGDNVESLSKYRQPILKLTLAVNHSIDASTGDFHTVAFGAKTIRLGGI